MASIDAEQHGLNVRKSARIATVIRSPDRVKDSNTNAMSRGRGHRRGVSLSAVSRTKATPPPVKVLKQKYRWLSEMDDESDSDSQSYESLGVSSEEENDDSLINSFTCIKLPELEESQPLEELKLPVSCDDLIIASEHVLQTIGIYEVLRHFYQPLRLAPFRVEDLCAALSLPDSCRLLDEIHVALLRVVVRSDEAVGTMFASVESKDSVAIVLFFGITDPITWFELCRLYVNCLPSNISLQQAVKIFKKCSSYADVTVEERLTLLQLFVDLFLATDVARDFLGLSNKEIEHESHCRNCNRVGDLLCCETCPAVYHLECIKPPLTDVPDEEWICPICEQLQVEGVTDCITEQELNGSPYRHEPLGYDRHNRTYWFICRRVFVDGNDGSVWYYSSPDQLDELRRVLGSGTEYPIEVDLLDAMNEMREEIVIHMNITAQLVEQYKGSKKSAIRLHDERIAKCRDEAGDKKEPKTNVEDQGESSDCPGVSSSEIDSNDVNERDSSDVKNEDSCYEKKNVDDNEISFENNLQESEVQTACGSQVGDMQHMDELFSEKSNCGEHISVAQEQFTVMESAVTVNVRESDNSNEAFFKSDLFQGDKGPVFQGCHGNVFQTGKGDMFQGGKGGDVFQGGKGDVFQGGNVFQGGKGDVFQGGKGDVFQGGKGDVFQGGKGDVFQGGEGDMFLDGKEDMFQDSKGDMIQSSKIGSYGGAKADVIVDGKDNMFQGVEHTSKCTELLTASNVSNPVIKSNVDNHVTMETEHDCYKDDVSSTSNQECNTTFPSWNCKQAPVNETSGSSPKSGVPVRVTRSMTGSLPHVLSERSSLSPVARRTSSRVKTSGQRSSSFKLGMEGTFTKYMNWYRTEALAQSKQQKSEERDKRRQLSYRFSMSSSDGGDFSWKGPLYSTVSSKLLFVDALRYAILSLDAQIATSFLHSGWRSRANSERWARAVRLCTTPRDFGIALSILVTCIKPVAFNSTWRESVGHTSFYYSTILEREEQKKRDRDQKRYKVFEDSWLALSKVHYTLGLHHQVWKQKDEEYRIFGNGGWLWLSSTRSRIQTSVASMQQSVADNCHPDKLDLETSKSVQCKTSALLDELLDRRLRPLRAQTQAMVVVGLQVKKFIASELEKHKQIKLVSDAEAKTRRVQQSYCYSTACKNNKDWSKCIYGCYSMSCRARSYLNRILAERETSAANSVGVRSLEKADSCIAPENTASLQVPSEKEVKIPTTRNIDSMIIYNVDTRLPVSVGPTNRRVSSGPKKGPTGIPVANKFMTRSGLTSIFILERQHLRKLARRGGLKFDPPGFAHNLSSKSERGYWPCPGPRPLFYQAWYYRTATACNLSAIALQLRVIRCCLRWDDMQSDVSSSMLEEVDGDMITKIEIKEKRDLEPEGLRSEYLVRRITMPLSVSNETQGDRPTSQRTGLRERVVKIVEPVITESWVHEEEIELWRLKQFSERGSRPHRSDSKRSVTAHKPTSDSKGKPAKYSEDDQQKIEAAAERRSSRLTERKRVTYDLDSSDSDSLESVVSNSSLRKLNPKLSSTSVQHSGEVRKTNAFTASRTLARSNPAAMLAKQSIRAVRGPDGKMIFTGLLPGQRVIQNADGHYKLVFSKSGQIPQAVTSSRGKNQQPSSMHLKVSGNHSGKNGKVDTKKRPRAAESSEPASHKRRRMSAIEAHKLLMDQIDSDKVDDDDDAITGGSDQEIPVLVAETISVSEPCSDLSFSCSKFSTPTNETIQSTANISVVEKSNLTQSNVSTKGTCPRRTKLVSMSTPGVLLQATKKQCSTPTPSVGVSPSKTESIMSNKSVSSSHSAAVPVSAAVVQSANTPISVQASTSKNNWSKVTSATNMDSMSTSSSTTAMPSLNKSADSRSALGTTSGLDVSSTSTVNQQLYCVCRTPYDETKFYIGCESCEDWFHLSCVGLSAEEVKVMSTYVCASCVRKRRVAVHPQIKLYCICQTPYNTQLTYIGCSNCKNWYHPRCVNLPEKNALQLSHWYCHRCSNKTPYNYNKHMVARTNMTDDQWQKVVCLLNRLKSASFDNQDPKFPVANFIDFEPIEKRLAGRLYDVLEDFVSDVLKLFAKVRRVHNETPLKRKAIGIFELSFANEIKNLRAVFTSSQKEGANVLGKEGT